MAESKAGRFAGAVLFVLALVGGAGKPAAAEPVLVFAAASLKNALDDVAAAYESETGQEITVSYAGSSALARQIQQGAPADLFISANPDWMDVLERGGLVRSDSRRDLLGNALVLVAHGRSAPSVEIGPGFDLAGRLGDGRLAMALVDAVPAGIYGKAALTSLGVWDAVAPSVAQADNVRAALALVARGEAPYGIVYATDAAAQDDVTVVGTFAADTHPPIIYPGALTSEAREPAAGLLEFLSSPAARPLWERHGFRVLE